MNSVEPTTPDPADESPNSDPDSLSERELTFLGAVLLAALEDGIQEERFVAQGRMIGVGLKPGSGEDVEVDGIKLGHVGRPKITRRVAGGNSQEFLDWAIENHPTEVEVATRVIQVPVTEEFPQVRSAFFARFKVGKTGQVEGPPGADGKPITDIPGLSVAPPSKSTPTVRPDREAIRYAWNTNPRLRELVQRTIPQLLAPTTTTEDTP